MRIFITGYRGHVGSELLKLGCLPLECDVTKDSEVRLAIDTKRPDLIVHLASKSDVDWCEEHIEDSILVNVRGFYYVAAGAEAKNIPVVSISSDHVFRGRSGPYRETGLTNLADRLPVNHYGWQKLSMESLAMGFKNVKVVRTSFGFDQARIDRILERIDKGWTFPTFMHRSFMHSQHFAKALLYFANHFSDMPYLLNIAGSETVSWYEFALAVATVYKVDKEKVLYHARDKKGHTPRPHKAGLVTKEAAKLGVPIRSYLDGIHLAHQLKINKEIGYG